MNYQTTARIIALTLTFTFALIGISFVLGANPRALTNLINIYSLDVLLSVNAAAFIAGGFFIICAASLSVSVFYQKWQKASVVLVAVLAAIPLLSLLSETRWLASLGGFPIIGSGQGIIKYFALLPLITFLFLREKLSETQHIWFNFFPAALVMLWIGSMKFYEFEAKGIESLVSTSPLMSWMYDIWDLQTTSNIIGVYDILAVIVLALAIVLKRDWLLYAGLVSVGAVFLTTQTFMFSTGTGFSAETLITSLSHFVLKDLWLALNLLVIYSVSKESKAVN